jgi:hypothetical protein
MAGEGVAAAQAEAQQGIAAAVADVKQLHNDVRATVLMPRVHDPYPQFYARDFEVAERGSIEAALLEAIRTDNWKSVVERPTTVAWEREQIFTRAYPRWEEDRGARLAALLERVRAQSHAPHETPQQDRSRPRERGQGYGW